MDDGIGNAANIASPNAHGRYSPLAMMALRILCLGIIGSLSSCAPARAQSTGFPQPAPPPAPREFRAVWVATVGNSNWPSKPGLPVEQQKQEMIRILDRAAAVHMNAVILQVRPGADALYASRLEPWSEYLTGTQGQAPSPYYDPLALWIQEAHRRGLELHAWFNPYRVGNQHSKSPLAANSIARTHPEIVKKYGPYLWLDPGEPLSNQHVLAVLLDLVSRYDIDGIHTDDYYYPYHVKDPKTGKDLDFPDEPSWQRYVQGGGKLSRADWRRSNINQFVSKLYTEVHHVKPWVKVGYAPFGIWKKGVPAGIDGLSQYDILYADPKLWLNQGWLDYLSPQLYWPIGGPQDFTALLNWWMSQNTHQRHVWPGLSIGKNDNAGILAQIAYTRRYSDHGVIFWSVAGIFPRNGRDLGAVLGQGPYASRALVPASPWLDSTPPAPPIVGAQRGTSVLVTLKPGSGKPTWLYAVYARYGDTWTFTTVPGGSPSLTLNPTAGGVLPNAIVVSAVDRTGNESPRVGMNLR